MKVFLQPSRSIKPVSKGGAIAKPMVCDMLITAVARPRPAGEKPLTYAANTGWIEGSLSPLPVKRERAETLESW